MAIENPAEAAIAANAAIASPGAIATPASVTAVAPVTPGAACAPCDFTLIVQGQPVTVDPLTEIGRGAAITACIAIAAPRAIAASTAVSAPATIAAPATITAVAIIQVYPGTGRVMPAIPPIAAMLPDLAVTARATRPAIGAVTPGAARTADDRIIIRQA
ncbi:hypothetical protein HOP51_20020 [Halomonas sp. MCCC 1A11036]|uniref:Uncharacterized protein n=1 Tax=Billgrantia zhangzhouensis TaxID=2733481 RepID=A0ABS9AL88_9GAMM|nr:hypothetical protein [Halomonas zhangzhouensis]MCE8022375.1 hypothetical protein [Halomonas zhangzhouensis]